MPTKIADGVYLIDEFATTEAVPCAGACSMLSDRLLPISLLSTNKVVCTPESVKPLSLLALGCVLGANHDAKLLA